MECWCGNNYGSKGNSTFSNCKILCSDNSRQFCGGIYRNLIYKTSLRKYIFTSIIFFSFIYIFI